MADPGPAPVAGEPVPPDLILKTLERIKESDAFGSSTVGRRLLVRAVLATVHNRTHELNENSLTQEFFPNKFGFRSSSFVKMRSVLKRLRGRLRVYYRAEGAQDEIIFEFRRGVYVPFIYRRDGSQPIVLQPDTDDDADGSHDEHADAVIEPAPRGVRSRTVEDRDTAQDYPPHKRRRRRSNVRKMVAIASIAVIALVVVAASVQLIMRTTGPSRPTPLQQFVDARNLTPGTAVSQDPSVGAGGRLIAFASDRDTQKNLNIYVQLLNGGGLRRLTSGEHDDSHPSLSPAGDTVAFRSEREPAGVYVVPASGGPAKMIVPEGRSPSFSPDGKWIAYWAFQTVESLQEPAVFVIPAEGGQPRRVFSNFASAQYPIWSPDGNMLLAVARARNSENAFSSAPQQFEWWASSIDGQTIKRTNVLASASSAVSYSPPYSWLAENRILFDGVSGLQRHLWVATLGPDLQLRSQPEKLSTSTSSDGQPIITLSGMLVFTNVQQQTQIWSVPANHSSLTSQGELNLLSMRPVPEFSPSISRDARKLVLLSQRPGDRPVAQIRSPGSGREEAVTNKLHARSPIVGRDGQHVAYLYPDTRQNKQKLEIQKTDRSIVEIECPRCERIFALSPDGRKVLYGGRIGMNPLFLGLADAGAQKHLTLIGHPSVVLSADLSPDGHTIVFSSRTREGGAYLYLSRLNGDTATDPVQLTTGNAIDDKPRFSPDGNAIYFLSNRDRFLCLYAVRFDPATGKVGAPTPVRHFHERSLTADAVSPIQQDLSVANERVILTLQRIQSSIWVARSN